MATEEIEISELEYKDDLIGDELLPVETSRTTFATSLNKIKDWILSIFENLNMNIGGIKTFTNKLVVSEQNHKMNYLYMKHPTMVAGVNPVSEMEGNCLNFADKNGVQMGVVSHVYQEDGGHYMHLKLTDKNGNQNNKVWFNFGFNGEDKPSLNMSQNIKSIMTSWGFPTGRTTNLSIGGSETKYKAPENGFFYVRMSKEEINKPSYISSAILSGNNVLLRSQNWIPSGIEAGNNVATFLPCIKGNYFYLSYYNAKPIEFKFCYAKGEE